MYRTFLGPTVMVALLAGMFACMAPAAAQTPRTVLDFVHQSGDMQVMANLIAK